jgi:hypothetical protein
MTTETVNPLHEGDDLTEVVKVVKDENGEVVEEITRGQMLRNLEDRRRRTNRGAHP